ncbi:MAG: glutathione S-transferase family protein [Woeseiaceae bacterium]|nr:glutathione S-transferase family protein [Woeseiaceae bacterium]
MTNYKLTYFDFNGGRGEPIRIAFHHGGIDFEDDRVSFPEFAETRDSMRFSSVPTMEIDGMVVTQTNAMLRHVGKQAGLYPDDELQAFYCDEAMEAIEDLLHRIVATFGLEGDELKAAREELAAGWLKTFINGLDELLARGGGEYFADGRLTVADLKVFMQTRSLASGTLDHVPTDFVEQLSPALAAHRDRIAADPIVTAYYAARTG